MEEYQKIIDYDNLREIVIVANTPMFLYNSFIRNQSIISLSTIYTEDELIHFFYTEYNKERDLNNVVSIYSIVIALSFKNSVHDFFVNIRKYDGIKWLEYISQKYFSKVIISNIELSIHPDYSIYNSSAIANNEVINFTL